MEHKRWLAALGTCTMLLSLASCGGGGAGDAGTNNAVSANQGTPAAGSTTPGNTQTGSTATSSAPTGCAPITGTGDVWLPGRLSCFSAGQKVLTYNPAAAGASSDVAVILAETVFDAGFNNILPGNKARHYKYFACLKNVPGGELGSSFVRLNIATDIAIIVRTENNSAKGNQIGAVTMEMSGGNQAGYAAQTCDSNRHPLIIDYATGKVLSVNPQALNAVETYDY